jgi:hypothetical protein
LEAAIVAAPGSPGDASAYEGLVRVVISNSRRREPAVGIGLTYALTDDLQLDSGVNLGITEAADDLQLFVGISRGF